MANNRNVVTCMYCEFFIRLENTSEIDIFKYSRGKCEKRDKTCLMEDQICDCFEIKSGLYTDKEYPNKENRKPAPFYFK